MGEDIHQLVYVKSKKTGKYSEIRELHVSEYLSLNAIIKKRNYNVFSLFGSERGNYKKINYANYGIPDFIHDTALNDYGQDKSYYGFVWFRFPFFKKAVTEYLDIIKKPWEYLKTDNEYGENSYRDKWIDLIKSGNRSTDDMIKFSEIYASWLDEHRYIIDKLLDINDDLDSFARLCQKSECLNTFDIDETVFLFFFDN